MQHVLVALIDLVCCGSDIAGDFHFNNNNNNSSSSS